uniref:Uncharacterized protein n=1 Tax=Eucampia antarctica TaxID=49252 RepID=A0A7S2W487_9STRA|mmetsp:Transcript_19372/g.18613  ORF Transcript_19372/g.18613 Transcript_19372/m.18613 type:complete len:313 (+) Transcript_19372:138-1076(+)|eukprot:CAMPEP_0197823784 /NCGR_PEP_ID=MMETSP1437-20131217/1087_1 /TAXON_ID=49252 ORGANISM="Eucampia antarctica, Strain CCMP1452" /NCGR_SAMPLE_ID=MMETSP1437 /ASSEMBLY_ACC=CAM_ASM_001096 /LENGTH=312 /DNA_ID=CAMNT_0043423111 /DNA_START=134 /DNA_END=1072 /DNA_ORIENTATION=-
MAFDRPLEADKIDDLGLFSSFLRAPIVGPIMWMIGGSSAMKKEEEEKEKVSTKNTVLNSPDQERKEPGRLNSYESDFMDIGVSPERFPSDVSDEGEGSDAFSSDDEPSTLPEMISKLNVHPYDISKKSLRRSKKIDHSLHNKTRRMSWSDESGQDLVHICDESKRPIHEPAFLSHSSSHKPIKSAIKRSLSSRDNMSNKPNYQPSQCVPSGLIGGKDGIIQPSCSGMKNTNGYISPQWGWYISTTPPTPERYSSKKMKSLDNSGPNISNVDGNESVRCNNSNSSTNDSNTPIFTREIKGIPKNVSGWPSVPL